MNCWVGSARIGADRSIEPDGEPNADAAREAISLFESRLENQVSSGDDLLLRLYLALALAEAIEIEDAQVRPSAGAEDFLSEDPAVAFESLFSFVHAFLEETMAEPETEDLEETQAW